jgi:hypothetical protein
MNFVCRNFNRLRALPTVENSLHEQRLVLLFLLPTVTHITSRNVLLYDLSNTSTGGVFLPCRITTASIGIRTHICNQA